MEVLGDPRILRHVASSFITALSLESLEARRAILLFRIFKPLVARKHFHWLQAE